MQIHTDRLILTVRPTEEVLAWVESLDDATGRVRIVRAHTRLDGAASMRVLTRSGFDHFGEVVDPEDGLVSRWEIRKEA